MTVDTPEADEHCGVDVGLAGQLPGAGGGGGGGGRHVVRAAGQCVEAGQGEHSIVHLLK